MRIHNSNKHAVAVGIRRKRRDGTTENSTINVYSGATQVTDDWEIDTARHPGMRMPEGVQLQDLPEKKEEPVPETEAKAEAETEAATGEEQKEAETPPENQEAAGTGEKSEQSPPEGQSGENKPPETGAGNELGVKSVNTRGNRNRGNRNR